MEFVLYVSGIRLAKRGGGHVKKYLTQKLVVQGFWHGSLVIVLLKRERESHSGPTLKNDEVAPETVTKST